MFAHHHHRSHYDGPWNPFPGVLILGMILIGLYIMFTLIWWIGEGGSLLALLHAQLYYVRHFFDHHSIW
jgi:hypothetical protein